MSSEWKKSSLILLIYAFVFGVLDRAFVSPNPSGVVTLYQRIIYHGASSFFSFVFMFCLSFPFVYLAVRKKKYSRAVFYRKTAACAFIANSVLFIGQIYLYFNPS